MSVDGTATYSTGEAAARCGLSRQGLLTWERRYGFPTPRRDDRGHRRYTERDLIDIARVRAAVGRGVQVEEAIAGLDGSSATGDAVEEAIVRNALDNIPVQVAILRAPTYEFVYVNRALARAVPTARVGTTVGDVLEGRGSTRALDHVLRTGDTWHEPAEPLVVSGELRFFAATYLRLAPLAGEPFHILGIGFDVTDTVRAQRAAARSEGALSDARAVNSEGRLVGALCRMAKTAATGSIERHLAVVLEVLTEQTDADAAALMIANREWLEPVAAHHDVRGLRWTRFPIAASENVAAALESGAITWIHASRSESRRENALLRRLVTKSMCVAPLPLRGLQPAALVLRWSLNEHRSSAGECFFIDAARSLVALSSEAWSRQRAVHTGMETGPGTDADE